MITRIPGNSWTLINVKKRNQKSKQQTMINVKANKQQTMINVKKKQNNV